MESYRGKVIDRDQRWSWIDVGDGRALEVCPSLFS